jgi:hypothetical protein
VGTVHSVPAVGLVSTTESERVRVAIVLLKKGMQAGPPTRGPKFTAMVLARNRLAIVELPNLSAAPQAAIDPAFNRRCFVCLGESPTPEPCGCACNGRYVHAGCQASLAAPSLRSARDAAFEVLSKTNCPDCNHMLEPGLILRGVRVPQAFLPVSGSAELQRIIDAEVIAAAELAMGRPRLAIRTVTTGLKLAMKLVHVDHPSSDVEKEIGYLAMLRMTELAALANAAAGKYDRAQPLMAAVTNKRQEQRDRDDAANFSAIVSWSNMDVIDTQKDVPEMVLPRQLDMFADLGTSPWWTETFTLAVLATNLGARLVLMQPSSLADNKLAARLSIFAHGAMTSVCGRQHRHTQQAARNADVVLGELDRHGAKSDGSKRSTCILRQVRRGYWPGLMKPVITRVAGTGHIPRLARTVC